LGVTNSFSSKSKPGNLLYLQGLIGSIPVRVLVDNGASISFVHSKIFKLLGRDANKSRRFVVTLGDRSECYTQGFVDVTLCLGSDLKFSVRLHIIEASFDGNDWQMAAIVNSGYYRTDSGISKGIEIEGRKFYYEGVNREISKVVEVQEGNLYDRSDDSKSSIPSETLNQDLHDLSQAHLLDPSTIPEYLWRQGTLYDPFNDELVTSPFPNLPEDTYLVNEIPSVNSDENVHEIFAAKVEISHLDLEEKEELLNAVSRFSDFFIAGIKVSPQTPLL